MPKDNASVCACVFCRDAIDFDLDPFLIDEIAAGNAVVFAGAGISTENRHSSPHSLYTELAVELGLDECDLPFPDLAEKFVRRPDGRFKLLRKVQERFDYIDKFFGLRRQATKFHAELATMPYFHTFVTTNWDRNFENACLAKPFVQDADIRFWDLPNRRVLKIHGTIDDYSSIVATREDYDGCEKRLHTSLVGAKLKEILSTKTCLFVGYSMRDEDFREIFSFVRAAQGKFQKVHYLIGPSAGESPLLENIIPIRTDGTYFLATIKEHMCRNHCYLRDETYDFAADELEGLLKDHSTLWDEFDGKEHPQVLVCASYQDGLIDGYRMILDRRGSGEFSDLHRLQPKIRAYEDKIRDYRSKRAYLDVAYFRGYQNSLIALALYGTSANEEDPLAAPRYFHVGIGEMHAEDFKEVFHELPDAHKMAFRLCKRVVSSWPEGQRMVIQHPPWG